MILCDDEPEAPEENDHRRLRRLAVSPEFLLFLKSGRYEVRENSLPSDARIVGYGADPVVQCLFVTFWSSEYPPVPEFETIPFADVPHIQTL